MTIYTPPYVDQGWNFDGRAGVITGAASGLGLETARVVGRRGAAVVIADIDPVAAEKAAAALTDEGVHATWIETDVKDRAAMRAALLHCQQQFGTLDFLHNNAGVLSPGSLTEVTARDLEVTLAVNVMGTFWGCREAIDLMTAQGTGGAIVNTASILAFSGDPLLPVYTASKHAVLGLTRALAIEPAVATSGIRINCVCPADMDTPLNDGYFNAQPDPAAARTELEAVYPNRRMAHPREVATAVAFLLSTDASFVSGTSITVDAGLLASAY